MASRFKPEAEVERKKRVDAKMKLVDAPACAVEAFKASSKYRSVMLASVGLAFTSGLRNIHKFVMEKNPDYDFTELHGLEAILSSLELEAMAAEEEEEGVTRLEGDDDDVSMMEGHAAGGDKGESCDPPEASPPLADDTIRVD